MHLEIIIKTLYKKIENDKNAAIYKGTLIKPFLFNDTFFLLLGNLIFGQIFYNKIK